jgi:hypothetical protein
MALSIPAKLRKKRIAAEPQPRELNHGFHGFHGFITVSALPAFIRVIRVIRGKNSSRKLATLTDCSAKGFPFMRLLRLFAAILFSQSFARSPLAARQRGGMALIYRVWTMANNEIAAKMRKKHKRFFVYAPSAPFRGYSLPPVFCAITLAARQGAFHFQAEKGTAPGNGCAPRQPPFASAGLANGNASMRRRRRLEVPKA